MTDAAVFMFAFMQQAGELKMTTGGWVFMIGAWTGILTLAIFCFSKILGRRKK